MRARFLAVLLVSSLVLASTGPVVLAQEAGEEATEEGRDNGNANTTIVDCSQVQNAFSVSQGQYGNANAVAQYESDAVAVVSQEMNITQSQVNACLAGQPDDGDNDDENIGNGDKEDAAAEKTSLEDGKDAVLAGTDPGGTLPETGGPSLLAGALGAALVVGGVSLIRFRR